MTSRRNASLALAIAGFLVVSLAGTCSAAFAGTGDDLAENAKPPLQIVNRTGLKVVVQVNHSDTMPNGIGKQVMATKNLLDQYAALGMKPGKDYQIVMVFRADGAQFLLTDPAYELKVKQPHPQGNPNKAILEALQARGVTMFECGVAMRLKGYAHQDLLPFSRIVVSGIGAVVDFEKSGYLPVTP